MNFSSNFYWWEFKTSVPSSISYPIGIFFLIFTHFHSLYSSYYFKYQSSSKYILYLLSETEYSSVLWSITIHLIYLPLAAAAAKSLQSCLTLCDPIDGKPPGSPVPGILQARILEWVAISFSNVWKWKVKVKSLSCVRLCYNKYQRLGGS